MLVKIIINYFTKHPSFSEKKYTYTLDITQPYVQMNISPTMTMLPT